MSEMSDSKLADLVRRWVAAEMERKVRKREFGYAFVMLRKVAEQRPQPPDGGHAEWEPLEGVGVESFKRAYSMMNCAYKKRAQSAAKAGALRAAITRACIKGIVIEPNAGVMEAYEELCEKEMTRYEPDYL